ncbi:ABC transporter ATP-binding protein [Micromonospora sp. RTGN7]|uniref:ABC transporter ATP-binding protein n=1 Tax=Micromonospora sp. RTGN7 TaxID=3016526 RepID=UPI0029FECDE0|nr:ABC transporter ATP-binding protein [Micromonospora sp. RTGN7]
MRNFPEPPVVTPDCRSSLRYLCWLASGFRTPILLGAVAGIACTVAQALIPAALGEAIDAGIVGRDRPALLWWGGVILVLGVVQALTGLGQDRCGLTASLGAAYRTLQLVTAQAARLGGTLRTVASTGEVVSVGVADITQLGAALETTGRFAGAVVVIVVVAGIMLSASWQLGLVVLVGVPAMLWAVGLLLRPLHGRQQHLRDQQAELTIHAVDISSGLRVLRGIGGEAEFSRRYRRMSQRVRGAGVRVAGVEAALDAAKTLLPGLLLVAVVWLGAESVLDGRLSVGQLVAFYGYAVFLATPLRRVADGADQFTRGNVAAARVVRLLNIEPEHASGTTALPDGPLELVDPDAGLTIQPGRFVAVACATPSDAALLADRLGRHTGTAVTFGGVPLRDVPLEQVRARILVTTNEDRLFAGPLRTELDPADRPDGLPAVLEASSSRDIIEALPDGLDQAVVGAGQEFSGGQRQRLRLARALNADPEVLVLVDPTSAVDAHTEARIAERLRQARAGRTTVVFTTSPIMLNAADRVAVVVDGRVVAEGAHQGLRGDARYRPIIAREDEA